MISIRHRLMIITFIFTVKSKLFIKKKEKKKKMMISWGLVSHLEKVDLHSSVAQV